VAAPLNFTGDRTRDESTAEAIRRVIDLAARVKCGKVRMHAMALPPRGSPAESAQALAELLIPLADHAGASGVCLLLQNGLSFPTAWAMWPVIEQANHSAVAIAWDPLAAALAGEAPGVSIPLLNSRIRQVMLRDASLIGVGTARQLGTYRKLGDGELAPAKLLDRLRGVGYRGWVSVAYPPPGDGTELGSPEDLLRHAMEQIRAWQPKPAKAAKPAAKKAMTGEKH
jgi:sugar phosphate isomerase/epimerase